MLNEAILCKWSWRYAIKANTPWKMVISVKYGVQVGGCYIKDGSGSFVSGWMDRRKEGLLLANHSRFIIGDGRRVHSWEDGWCSLSLLCMTFPLMYSFVDSKGGSAADVWNFDGEFGGWDTQFSRSFNNWVLDQVCNFVEISQN